MLHLCCMAAGAGRLLVAQAAVDATKIGVTIALRYAASRPQVGNPGTALH